MTRYALAAFNKPKGFRFLKEDADRTKAYLEENMKLLKAVES